MNRDLFGTDGVRGRAGEYPLDVNGVHSIGMAVGTLFAKVGQQIIVGHDTRESCEQILSDLTAGLTEVGVEVIVVGVIPTPGLAYLTREGDDYVAGIMITASHNTFEYNGIKVFDSSGDKLNDETEATLNKLIVEGVSSKQPGSITKNHELISEYEDFLVNSADGLQLNGLNIAVDTANGAASEIGQKVFTRLGANVTALFNEPNGQNINSGCGATHTSSLAETVTANRLALGIALDGDADRLIMIDNLGREVKGDYILYILAVSNHCKGVVATVMSNLGFELALKRVGIMLDRTDVGDRYVLEGLQTTGYKLGGEQSGHIILPDLLKTGDGLLAAVQTMKAVNSSNKSLSQWCDEVELLPQALVNIELENKTVLNSSEVKDFIREQTDAMAGKGRVLIRPSGTEPLARVMVEADGADQKATHIAEELKKLIAQISPGENA